MNKEMILKSDVLDIVFENRNKAYGAYDLRKFYNNRLIKSLGVMLGAVIVLSAFTFLPKKKSRVIIEPYTTSPFVLADRPKEKEKPKEPDKPKEAVKPPTQAPTQVFIKPVVVPDKVIASIENLKDSVAFAGVLGGTDILDPTAIIVLG